MVDDNITKRVYLAAEDRDLDSEKDGQSVYDYWRGRPIIEFLDSIYKDNETFRYKANNYDAVLKEYNDLKVLKEQEKNQAPVPIPTAPEPPKVQPQMVDNVAPVTDPVANGVVIPVTVKPPTPKSVVGVARASSHGWLWVLLAAVAAAVAVILH